MSSTPPPVKLILNVGKIKANQKCSECKNPVKGDYLPIQCKSHCGDPRNPPKGWAFITAEEAQLLTILRTQDWTSDALQELLETIRQTASSMSSASSTASASSEDSAIIRLSRATENVRLDRSLSLNDLDDSASSMDISYSTPGTPTE